MRPIPEIWRSNPLEPATETLLFTILEICFHGLQLRKICTSTRQTAQWCLGRNGMLQVSKVCIGTVCGVLEGHNPAAKSKSGANSVALTYASAAARNHSLPYLLCRNHTIKTTTAAPSTPPPAPMPLPAPASAEARAPAPSPTSSSSTGTSTSWTGSTSYQRQRRRHCYRYHVSAQPFLHSRGGCLAFLKKQGWLLYGLHFLFRCKFRPIRLY